MQIKCSVRLRKWVPKGDPGKPEGDFINDGQEVYTLLYMHAGTCYGYKFSVYDKTQLPVIFNFTDILEFHTTLSDL